MAKRPTHVADDPELSTAREAVTKLEVKAAEIREIIDRLRTGATQQEFAEAVAAVVDGSDPVVAARDLDHTRALAAAESSLDLVFAAIVRAKGVAEEAAVAARKRFVASVLPRHRALTAKVAAALVALGEAQIAALEFEAEMRAAGVARWPDDAGPVGVASIGNPTDDRSLLAGWLIASIHTGALDVDAVPPAWAGGWPLLRSLRRAGGKDLDFAEAMRLRRLRTEVGAPSGRVGRLVRRAG